MMRRFYFFGVAIICGCQVATVAWGQSSSETSSLAERMAAMRRHAVQTASGEQDATANPRRLPAAKRQSPGRSLLPSWFTRENEPQDEQPALEPRAGSAQAAPMPQPPTANSATLPGLGGSRLPEGKWTPSHNNAAARQNVARDMSSDYPVIRDVSPQTPTTPRRSAQVQSPVADSTTRHSPPRRLAPQISPDELHRELSGSFSSGSTGPTARIARANNSNQPADEPAATPMALPQADSAPPAQTTRTPQPLKLEKTEPQVAPDNSLPPGAAEAFGAPATHSNPFGPTSFTRSPRMNAAPANPIAIDRRKEAFGEALQVANGGDPSVLVSNQAPIITADIRGPKQILVGREAVYRVRLQNEGAAAAEGIVATVRIPSWADVEGMVATQGTVQPSQASTTQLEWQLPRMEGRTSETLDVRLIPRESRPLELGITWTVAPVGSRAIVEVQEPKLAIDVAGPNEVFFDKPQVFKLTLSNPGTGPAENVNIQLVPPGAAQAPASHPLGNLEPGESKTVEIELTAREAGKLQIKAIASAEGDLTSEMAKEIFCRKPELEVDWRGPATQYAGTAATYFFRVRNPGTAPAEEVTVDVTLPEGAEFNSASEGQTFDPQHRQVKWHVGTLSPGDDNYMELKCVVKKPGANQFVMNAATAAGDLTDNATAETNVIALADLKLEVTDPSGAVAVGSPALYEIRIANRGASPAKDVTVVGLFSQGIEPDQAEGAMYSVADGRVAFQPIDELAAGREITLRIRAHAVQPGTHVFRAEVLCSDAEIKLAAEESTRFYKDDVSEEADRAQQQSAAQTSFEATLR